VNDPRLAHGGNGAGVDQCFAFRAFRVIWLFVQSRRRSFEIGEDGGPTFFTESFDHGTLGGLPSRREFLDLFSAFGRNCQFHKPAAPPAPGLHQTVSCLELEARVGIGPKTPDLREQFAGFYG